MTFVIHDKMINNIINDRGRDMSFGSKSYLVPAPAFSPNENDVLRSNCQPLHDLGEG